MATRDDARRIAETLLRTAGRAVVVRVWQAAAAPPMEAVLKPCFLQVKGETAELTVAAGALADVAGLPEEVFGVTARVVAGPTVWRVASYAAMECGETVIGWRVQLAR